MEKQQGDFVKVIFSLGSNMGNRLDYLRRAANKLTDCGALSRVSSVVESEAWGYRDSKPYLNAVIALKTKWDVESIFRLLTQIELDLGRDRNEADGYQARKIDIDILYYGNQVISTDELEIPHPRLHLRNFVLRPLTEVLPNFRHPILHKSSVELLKLSPDSGRVQYFSSLFE